MAGTFEGLAVPLYGEYIQYMGSATSTAYWTVNNFGEIDQKALHNAAGNTARGVNYMEGVHLETRITTTTEGSDALWAGVFHDSGTCSGQIYAAEFWYEGAASLNNDGGRSAVINLIFNAPSSYTVSTASASYINFTAVDRLMPALFTFTGETAGGSGGCFQAGGSTASCTHLLTIYVANTKYYIMVAAQSSA